MPNQQVFSRQPLNAFAYVADPIESDPVGIIDGQDAQAAKVDCMNTHNGGILDTPMCVYSSQNDTKALRRLMNSCICDA
jgi:hypothetical protein